MGSSVQVIVVEDDPYSRDFMTMLLMRDWRTRVVADVGNDKELDSFLSRTNQRVDVILIDTEAPHHLGWLDNTTKIIISNNLSCSILCTGTIPHQSTLKKIIQLKCQGYVIKSEISYGLAAAVRFAALKKWVTTPSVDNLSRSLNIALPKDKKIIINHVGLDPLTNREKQVAKQAILFNLSQRDVSDEMIISPGQVGKYVNECYTKIGLNDILDGQTLPKPFFHSQLVRKRFQKAQAQQQAEKSRVSNKATLAFHLLTLIEEIDG